MEHEVALRFAEQPRLGLARRVRCTHARRGDRPGSHFVMARERAPVRVLETTGQSDVRPRGGREGGGEEGEGIGESTGGLEERERSRGEGAGRGAQRLQEGRGEGGGRA